MDIKTIAKEYNDSDVSLDYLASKYRLTRETLRRKFIKLGIERKNKSRKIRLNHPSKFQKGNLPWNKGVKYDDAMKDRLNLRGLSIGHQQGEKHHLWKGEFASYAALHYWIYRKLGKASFCSFNNAHKSTRYHWANISKKYKRDIKDFISLCPSCHRLYDLKK